MLRSLERGPAPEVCSLNASSTIAQLHRERPKSQLLRGSALVLALFALWALVSGEIAWLDLFCADRLENLKRFIATDAYPHALKEDGLSLGGLLGWAGAIFEERGASAALRTLWISIAAIVIAGGVAAVLAPLGARTIMNCDPFVIDSATDRRRCFLPWTQLSSCVRIGFILLRAIPEYIWAFLLLAMLGPSAWPAILALAIHNTGILCRLGADTIENLDKRALLALRMLGSRRLPLLFGGVLPMVLSRFLLYFFYRWETCVREATVLGMLGVVSLGYWIQDARVRQHYDEMLLFVGMGAALVLLGDMLSLGMRAWIRRAR